MSNALPAREQSMDEILASIRRIIENDDEKARRSSVALGREKTGPAGPAHEAGKPGAPGLAGPSVVSPQPKAEEKPAARPASVTPLPVPGLRPAEALPSQTSMPAEAPAPVIAPAPSTATAHRSEAQAETLVVSRDDDSQTTDDLAAARSRAASLVDANERRRGDAVTELRPANGAPLPRPADGSPLAAAPLSGKAEMPQWPEAIAANDRPAPESLDTDAFLGEFDEQDFARELLDKVGLIEPASPASAPAPQQAAGPAGAPLSETGAAAGTFDGDPADGPMRVAHALISQEAGERVAASFSSLATAIQQEHLRDVDGVVREMLRPMLQEWLDDNLPKMVERLVREEIERVARGGR